MEAVMIVVLIGGALAVGFFVNRWYLSKPRNFQADGQTYTRHPDGSFTRKDGSALSGEALARVRQRWDEIRQSNNDLNNRDYEFPSSD